MESVESVSRRDGPLHAVGEGNRVQGDGEVEQADEGQERRKLRDCHAKGSKPNGVWQRQNNRVHNGHYRSPRYDSKRGRNRDERRDSPPPSLRDTLRGKNSSPYLIGGHSEALQPEGDISLHRKT